MAGHRYITLKFRAAAATAAALVYVLLNSMPAAAAFSGINLTTSPLPVNLNANPGSTVTTDLRIQNANDKTQKIKLSLMKFSAYGESGKPALQDRAPGDDYFDWVSFSPAVFDAPPKQWVSVKMTIKIPKEAAFGYYYAVVFSPADQKPTGTGNVFLGSTAILVLLDVNSPNAKRSAKVVDFSTDRKTYEFLPVTFSVRLHIAFNSQHGSILPNSYRVYTASWDDGFPVYSDKIQDGKVVLDKNDRPVKVLNWNINKIAHLKFGRYTANLLAVYDNGQRDVPMEASVSFWVVPWRLVFIGLAFIALIGGLITYVIVLRRRLKRAGPISRGHKK